jgi:phosphoribosylanthranilate isomerase
MSTRIKFCGLTEPIDAELAVETGAWALGMIFWKGSPRRCKLSRAIEIAEAVQRRVELAGVFVNAPLSDVTTMADTIGLTLVQLHGDEGPSYCAEVARRTGARVIKAARVSGRADIQALEPFHVDFHLLDSFRPGVPGGTGETFAWELLAGRRRRVPLILSGGLTAENVADGIAAVAPYAVDVASGVELAPGLKDPEALQAFAAAVRAADGAAAETSAA